MRLHEWLYCTDDNREVAGPITEPDLCDLISRGKLGPESLVKSATRTNAQWVKIAELPSLMQLWQDGKSNREDDRSDRSHPLALAALCISPFCVVIALVAALQLAKPRAESVATTDYPSNAARDTDSSETNWQREEDASADRSTYPLTSSHQPQTTIPVAPRYDTPPPWKTNSGPYVSEHGFAIQFPSGWTIKPPLVSSAILIKAIHQTDSGTATLAVNAIENWDGELSADTPNVFFRRLLEKDPKARLLDSGTERINGLNSCWMKCSISQVGSEAFSLMYYIQSGRTLYFLSGTCAIGGRNWFDSVEPAFRSAIRTFEIETTQPESVEPPQDLQNVGIAKIGSKRLYVDAPRGFVITDSQEVLTTLTVPTKSTMHVVFITAMDAARILNGDAPILDRYVGVQTSGDLDSRRISPEEFSELKEYMRTNTPSKQAIAKNREAVNELVASRGIEVETLLIVGYEDDSDTYTITSLVKAKNQRTRVVSLSTRNCDGYIVMIATSAACNSEDDINWATSTALECAKSIR